MLISCNAISTIILSSKIFFAYFMLKFMHFLKTLGNTQTPQIILIESLTFSLQHAECSKLLIGDMINL